MRRLLKWLHKLLSDYLYGNENQLVEADPGRKPRNISRKLSVKANITEDCMMFRVDFAENGFILSRSWYDEKENHHNRVMLIPQEADFCKEVAEFIQIEVYKR